MIKTLLLFLFIVIFVWLTQDYFAITLPTQEANRSKEDHSSSIQNKDILVSHVHHPIRISEDTESLTSLLEQHRFYDAMAYYLENSTTLNLEKIELYLAALANTSPVLALEYMEVFLDSVPESSVLKLMITTHIAHENYHKAIELIMDTKENYVSEAEDKRLATQLRNVAIKYIETLLDKSEYEKLITFLEEMMAHDDTDSFYKFRLAQLYMKLDKVEEAGVLLDVLQYDEVYAQNAKSLLSSIHTKKEDGYEFSIPLQRYGDHYTVNALLEGNNFNLMLDTGATYILLDATKANSFEIIRDDLRLQTVGNEVSAKLANVHTMQIGNLSLTNTQVTIAPFQRNGIDGLLGMNFFKQFRFFINQEEGVLYLNPK